MVSAFDSWLIAVWFTVIVGVWVHLFDSMTGIIIFIGATILASILYWKPLEKKG